MKIDLSQLGTEKRNQNSADIDTLSTLEILTVINNEDQTVPLAVAQTLPEITQAVDAIVNAFQAGGRLIYCGAGTSGRLGILDASECPPTFGSDSSLVMGLIAGGHAAILKAVENAEDNIELGKKDLQSIHFQAQDILVGIAASGRTPYVIGAMQHALSLSATVISLSCNVNSPMTKLANINITPQVGPEVVTGSSRMKAGTAQKLVLNMLTTAAMIRSGKVFSNLMVDVQASNEKLVQRQINIVIEATGCTEQHAIEALKQTNSHCKTAILMILSGLNAETATAKLKQHQGFVRNALADCQMD
ncbi:N-acetylmuramic acid 6-phosphate etherase [Psychromonas sp. MME2]|uniref:N-acetylmuramic acid 6-phosphate etherase n=1 Tax=unclassified Psychromonas TaxID=2614957 RepID=UPI00339CBF25